MLMKFLDCRLNPKAPFHIGVREGGLEETLHYIPSDTLFSGFCNVYRMLYGSEDLKTLLSEFQEKPPFLFSSVFPMIKNIPLFPLPRHLRLHRYEEQLNLKLKRVEYVSEGYFHKILGNKELEIRPEDVTQGGRALVEGFSPGMSDEVVSDTIWRVEQVPRVVLDRKTNASEIYYFGQVVFLDQLHFLIDIRNEKYRKRIETTMRVLGDEGLGGDRTNGKGLFTVEGFHDITFDDVNSPWFLTLSLYHPQKHEVSGLHGYFEFVQRGGWGDSVDSKGIRKKMVRLFAEGSVFNKHVIGDLVEVGKGSHPFYRYGYAFSLPIQVKT
jgi:CRISPR-associated protein Csm4